MRKTPLLFAFVLTIALVGCGNKASSQNAPSAQVILEKTCAAYKNLQSLIAESESSKESITGGKREVTKYRGEVTFQRPSSFFYASVENQTGAHAIIYISDGKQSYCNSEKSGEFYSLATEELSTVFDLMGLDGPYNLATTDNPFKKAQDVKLAGSEKVDGIDTYIIEFRWPMDTARCNDRYWIGKSDYLIRKTWTHQEATAEEQRKGVPEKYWEQIKGYNVTLTKRYTRLEPNAKIDPAEFTLPPGAKVLPRTGGRLERVR